MKIKVLGGHGGLAKGFSTTSFLIDDVLLVDAGNVAGPLTIEEQVRIDHILISHCHLDHIKDLAFICDNCFGLKDRPFRVYTHATVNKMIKSHLLNDIIWPDFTVLPNAEQPTMEIHSIEEEKVLKLGEYTITPIKVNHPLDTMGFIIEKGNTSVLFTLDTGPTERIWEVARGVKNLKAIFTEVSFPNSLSKVAVLSDHHTPHTIGEEIKKMPENVPVILTHLKPNYRTDILSEIEKLKEDRIRVLENDGEVFEFI
jgi:ribonuclease BN (tRNA processing enzyme)